MEQSCSKRGGGHAPPSRGIMGGGRDETNKRKYVTLRVKSYSYSIISL